MAASDHSRSYARTAVFINGITRTLNFTTNIKNNGEILCFERTAANDHSSSYARTVVLLHHVINGITRTLIGCNFSLIHSDTLEEL